MRRVLYAVLVLVVLALLAGGGFLWADYRYNQPGPLADARNVVIPHGGLDTVAPVLAKAGVIDSERDFRIAAELTRGEGPIHAAELAFPAGASLHQVLAVLRTGKPVQHHLTIPEGLTAAQIAEILDHAEALTGDPVVPQEGEMLPQTYSYEFGTTREAILTRAHAAMRRTVQEEWANRAPNLPLASPHDLLVLASIVERETGKPEERPMVAAVFENRLRLGMPLQSDPTVAYGASGGLGKLDRAITRADLERADPYNTYRIPGLPPGPICSPGMAAIKAVAQPAPSDALYFVADGTGGHAFARTLAEHEVNVAHYRSLSAEAAHPEMSRP
jgi:UPF0755 protein